MLKADLLEIIANGENSGVDFKRDDIRPEQLAKEIVALANLRGGMVLLGVEDDGSISGIQRDNLEEWIMDTVFGRYIHPLLLPFYEVVTLDDGKRVAVISITAGTSKPYVLRHNGREDIYVRLGSVSRLATREQQARLFESGGMLHSEMLPVSGAGFEALDRERVQDYLLTLAGDRELPTTDDAWLRRMIGLGFMTEAGAAIPVCTIAGLVLFGRTPRRFLRQAGVRWMAFDGNDKDYQALDDTVLDGPLVARFDVGGARELIEPGLIEALMDKMRPFISLEDESLEEGLRRQRRWHYPPEALREAIINALAHRDWTRELAHHRGRARDFVDGLLLDPESGQDRRRHRIGYRPAHDLAHEIDHFIEKDFPVLDGALQGGLRGDRHGGAYRFTAMLGQNRLGVKLHPVYRVFPMAQPHDFLHRTIDVFRPRGDFKAIGQGVFVHHQRVIAGRGQPVRQPREHPVAVMADGRGLAVHDLACAHHLAAIHLADTLMPEADPEDRHARAQAADDLQRHPGLIGHPRPGRNHDARGRARGNGIHLQRIIAHHVNLRTQGLEILHQIPGE